jgi:hypothetical protein
LIPFPGAKGSHEHPIESPLRFASSRPERPDHRPLALAEMGRSMTQSLTADPAALAPAPAMDAAKDLVEVVASRQPEGHGFHFKVRASGRVYRLDSARDPRQPRFWCFRISRCASAGVVDATERPWYGGDRMTREDLPAAIAAIRAAPADWLALPQHGDLREWVLEDRLIEALPPALAPASARRVRTE